MSEFSLEKTKMAVFKAFWKLYGFGLTTFSDKQFRGTFLFSMSF